MQTFPIVFIASLTLLLLHLGKFIFIPLFLSLFAFVIMKSLSNKLNSFSKKLFQFKLNNFFSFSAVFILISLTFYFIWKILKFNLLQVISRSDYYQTNLESILKNFSNILSTKILINFQDIIEKIDFEKIFSFSLNYTTQLAGNFSLVIVYLIFIFLEEKFFLRKLNNFFKDKKFLNILEKIGNNIFSYFQLKTLTSFLTGFLTFLALFCLNSDLAPFFGLVAFALNFIPVIGSLFSVILPFIFSCVQFLNFFEPLIILFLLFAIQILIGNFFEPKLLGKSLNISPLIMILTLSLMGKLWGLTGMFLSVPLLVICLIVFNNFKSTKKIALLISERGINK